MADKTRKMKVRLAECAEESGVSLRQISRDTKIGIANLSRIKSGLQLPRMATIEILCNYLGCQPGDLLKMV